MAATTTLHFAMFAVSACALLVASVSSSMPPAVYKVGDERGWAVPANGSETYNHWARRNRIQVGDVLNFKYANDSVLLVSHDDYKQCSTEAPVSRFTSGDTKFKLDRYGPLYFVSGVAGHCEAGQRMIVRVRAPSALNGAPAAAPGMPPTTVVGGRGGAPSPAAFSPAVPSIGSGSGAGAASTAPPITSPSPLPQASGASSSRRVRGVVSSVAVGLAVLVASAITLSVVV